ncbi:hypothetical protein BBD42_01985 [Paenibacillus sp. BIHB 4019]|uniref:Uncharacterized protein n=1 Tax=Paenibacillus sp. BIHB 4019 TaxID=1870819 RepID=A0A1B2DCF7_9BACL|nr:hypothetical protein [Paenibacillus sp. BIHB 4019]ANY65375.1 hypothetical protein BBD42_01985 [Paenibacillus sp. BIHB 4019]
MTNNRIYLFFGFGEGSEYVLHPLYQYMKDLNYNCIEIDMMKQQNAIDVIKPLRGKDIIFITSAHLFMDKKNFSPYYQDDGIISALEIIEYLKPKKCIYYPHDLVTPVLSQDSMWLSLFDVFLSPLPNLNHLKRYAEVVEVGWIKKQKNTPPSHYVAGEDLRVAFAMSSIGYYFKKGYDFTYEFWKPLFDEGIGIKLPFWPNVIEFESYLEKKGVNIFPSHTNILDLIHSNDIIITNSTTSVTIEAGLSGRMVLNVLDNVVPRQEQLSYGIGISSISSLPLEDCMKTIEQIKAGDMPVRNAPEFILPFNFELATKILTV